MKKHLSHLSLDFNESSKSSEKRWNSAIESCRRGSSEALVNSVTDSHYTEREFGSVWIRLLRACEWLSLLNRFKLKNPLTRCTPLEPTFRTKRSIWLWIELWKFQTKIFRMSRFIFHNSVEIRFLFSCNPEHTQQMPQINKLNLLNAPWKCVLFLGRFYRRRRPLEELLEMELAAEEAL